MSLWERLLSTYYYTAPKCGGKFLLLIVFLLTSCESSDKDLYSEYKNCEYVKIAEPVNYNFKVDEILGVPGCASSASVTHPKQKSNRHIL